jgi:hypothetical protein
MVEHMANSSAYIQYSRHHVYYFRIRVLLHLQNQLNIPRSCSIKLLSPKDSPNGVFSVPCIEVVPQTFVLNYSQRISRNLWNPKPSNVY